MKFGKKLNIVSKTNFIVNTFAIKHLYSDYFTVNIFAMKNIYKKLKLIL